MKPVNRHLLIEPKVEAEEENASPFLLPEGYKTKKIERYEIVTILQHADDCKITHLGQADVEASMIEQIHINSNTYHIIPENYVVLLLETK